MISPKNNATIFAKIGHNLTIECAALSDGSIHFQLIVLRPNATSNGSIELSVLKKQTKSRTVYDESNTGSSLRKFITTYHFYNITESDMRSYTCMAGNGVGFSTTSFTLKQFPVPSTVFTEGPGKINNNQIDKYYKNILSFSYISTMSNLHILFSSEKNILF